MPSAETTIWPTTSWPPVSGFNVSRLRTEPGLKPAVLGRVSCTGCGQARSDDIVQEACRCSRPGGMCWAESAAESWAT